MAAVAYTSTTADADYYQSEMEREMREIEEVPETERDEIRQIYRDYGFEGGELESIVKKITSNKSIWLEVMMSQELKLEPVDRKTAFSSGIIVGISAPIGSFIPLTAFFFFPVAMAMIISLTISSLTLFVVGFYKARVTIGRHFIRQRIEMMAIGMVSALVGCGIGLILKV